MISKRAFAAAFIGILLIIPKPKFPFEDKLLGALHKLVIATEHFIRPHKKDQIDSPEIENLRGEIVALNAQLQRQENSAELNSFRRRYSLENAVLAKIFARNLDSASEILVDAGSSRGIHPGMVAIYKFQILGQVSEAHEESSKIMLITNPNSSASAYVTPGGHNGIVQGMGSKGSPEFKHFNEQIPLTKGDLILSSGQGTVFPEGFCLGKITADREPGSDESVVIEPLAPFDKIKFCHIVDREKLGF